MIGKKDYEFTKKVWIQLKRYKHKSIKLLVSGGADSLALLLVVSYCRDVLKQNLDLEVITFNHGLRAAAKAEGSRTNLHQRDEDPTLRELS